MKPEMRTFLKDGIRLYTNAKDTVKMFENEMQKSLRVAVDAHKFWAPFKKHVVKGRSSGGDGDYWMYLSIHGEDQGERKARIECGLWWNAPHIDDPIVYTGLWINDKRMKIEWQDEKNSIRSFKFGDGSYIYIPIPSSTEIVQPVSQLLAAILSQYGKMTEQSKS